MAVTQITETARRNMIKQLKEKLVLEIENYSSVLTDEDIKNALISLTTVGWKQEDGSWRKL